MIRRAGLSPTTLAARVRYPLTCSERMLLCLLAYIAPNT